MDQSSHDSSPQREAHEDAVDVIVVVEDDMISNDAQLEVINNIVAHSNSTAAERQTIIDVLPDQVLLDEQLNYFHDALEDFELETYEKVLWKTHLYHAALNGDWEGAQSIFCYESSSIQISDSITPDNENALHISAGSKHIAFVEKLINIMDVKDIAKKDKYGNTALCFAATSGVVQIAKLMVQKNTHLPLIGNFENITPLFLAVSYKHREMVSYLFSVTKFENLEPKHQIDLFIATIQSDFFDVGLKMLSINKKLATMRDTKNNETLLHVLARKPSVISSSDDINIWKNRINSCIKSIYHKDVTKTLARQLLADLWDYVLYDLSGERTLVLKFINQPTRLLHDAARAGNVEFLIQLIDWYPYIAWEGDDDGKTIFHIAVENRLENVFNLIHGISVIKDFATKYRPIGKEKYNMLHLAAKLAAPNHLNRISGAALQMQRELIWFKEVEKIVLPSQLDAKCDDDSLGKLTPRELFTIEHKDLRKEGEEWMKNTASSCMLVATLIATVVFAAAFTIPGGSDDNNGTPIYRQKLWFTVFIISDALALVTSSCSILMFLSMLTSRYGEDDFLHSLPSRLLLGLTTLFISIVCMVVAFSATFFLLYHDASIEVPLTVAAMAIVPVSCCALQFKLWVDTFRNTYLSRFLFKSCQRKLFSSDSIRKENLYHERNERKKGKHS